MIKKNTNYIIGALVIVAILVLVFSLAGKNKKIEAPTNNTPQVVSEEEKKTQLNEKVTPGGAASRIYLATRLNVPVQDVRVVKEEMKEWPDSCLGIAPTGVSCATVITSGYEITLDVKGTTYVYRTNLTGSLVKATN